MAGNLPIKTNITTTKPQLTQSAFGMPNMSLPTLKQADIPLQQISIFTSKPIIDITRMPNDTELSAIFGPKQNPQIQPQDIKNKPLSQEEFLKQKEEIKAFLRKKFIFSYSELNQVINGINKDNLAIAWKLCRSEYFKSNEDLLGLASIIKASTKAGNKNAEEILSQNEDMLERKEFLEIAAIMWRAKNTENIEMSSRTETSVKNESNGLEEAERVISDEEFENRKQDIRATLLKRKNENKDIIENIVEKLNKDNLEAIEILVKYNKGISIIGDAVDVINKDNRKLAKKIIKDSKYLGYELKIIAAINIDNRDFALWLSEHDDIFGRNKSEDVLKIIAATNKDNREFAQWLCEKEELVKEYREYIPGIIAATDQNNENFAKWLLADEKNKNLWTVENIKYFDDIIRETNTENMELAKKVVQNKFIPVKMMSYVLKNNTDPDIFEKIDNYRKKMLQNPELYINGEVTLYSKIIIESFLENNYSSLVKVFDIFDKEAIDNLFRRRLDDAEEYLDIIDEFEAKELQLLKKIVSCNNMSGKPLMPVQKVECIDLIKAFKDNNISLFGMEISIIDNKIDLEKIKLDLLEMILEDCGMEEEEIESIPKEKLMSWNLEYMHLLPKSMDEDEEAFIDLLNGANSDDFLEYIHDANNDYGKANEGTVSEFEALNMNYEKWLHPDKELETTFAARDKNSELLLQLVTSILEDIKELRENSAIKGFFDKQFKQYIEKDEFKIPQKIAKSKANLTELINNIIEQLKPVWERAEKNKDNSQKQETARKTLTLLSHLQTKVESLQKINDIKTEKPFEVTIRMWDRIPQKDLFQGNFSTCCIGMGECNAGTIPHYLMNTAFNMIEMVDNNTGKTIGNALCYFAQDENGKLMFVIDNIEINNSQKPSTQVGIQLRETMFAYAKNIVRAVTGKDTEVIMSGSYNDVSLEGLYRKSKSLKLVGDVDCEEIYMDLFGGWTDDWEDFEQVEYYGK